MDTVGHDPINVQPRIQKAILKPREEPWTSILFPFRGSVESYGIGVYRR